MYARGPDGVGVERIGAGHSEAYQCDDSDDSGRTACSSDAGTELGSDEGGGGEDAGLRREVAEAARRAERADDVVLRAEAPGLYVAAAELYAGAAAQCRCPAARPALQATASELAARGRHLARQIADASRTHAACRAQQSSPPQARNQPTDRAAYQGERAAAQRRARRDARVRAAQHKPHADMTPDMMNSDNQETATDSSSEVLDDGTSDATVSTSEAHRQLLSEAEADVGEADSVANDPVETLSSSICCGLEADMEALRQHLEQMFTGEDLEPEPELAQSGPTVEQALAHDSYLNSEPDFWHGVDSQATHNATTWPPVSTRDSWVGLARDSSSSDQRIPQTSASAKLQKEIDAVQAELDEIQAAHGHLQAEADLGESDAIAKDLDVTLHGLEADMEDLRQHLEQMKKLQRRANATRAKRVPRTPVGSVIKRSQASRAKAPGLCTSSPRK